MEANEGGAPLAIIISQVRRAVESVQEAWRIDDEWWRTQRVSRLYWRALLEDGRMVDVYHDLVSDRWFKQAYAG